MDAIFEYMFGGTRNNYFDAQNIFRKEDIFLLILSKFYKCHPWRSGLLVKASQSGLDLEVAFGALRLRCSLTVTTLLRLEGNRRLCIEFNRLVLSPNDKN